MPLAGSPAWRCEASPRMILAAMFAVGLTQCGKQPSATGCPWSTSRVAESDSGL